MGCRQRGPLPGAHHGGACPGGSGRAAPQLTRGEDEAQRRPQQARGACRSGSRRPLRRHGAGFSGALAATAPVCGPSPHPGGVAQGPQEASGWRVQGLMVGGVQAAGGRYLRVPGWAVEGGTGARPCGPQAALLWEGRCRVGGPLARTPMGTVSQGPSPALPVPSIHGLSPRGALPGVLRARAQVAGCLRSSHQGRGWPMGAQVGWGQRDRG